MTPARTILVIDDHTGVAGSLQQRGFLRNYASLPYVFVFESCLTDLGYNAGPALLAAERETDASLVLLDLKFGPDDMLLGLEILRALTARFPSLPVLVLSSAERDVELLGQCLEEGAVGFIEKHRSANHLQVAVEQAVELMHSHVLLGQSPPLKELRRQAARLSPYDEIPVFIVGERGTGKERVARYIHHNGPRSEGPFVAVNCAGVPDALFESEFFGAEKGAYTGAYARRAGFLERAHMGTLFLDEVGTLPSAMQAKLLRVLQDHRFFRLGSGTEEVISDFQLLSATNSDPLQLIAAGALREDFHDRIAAVTIRTPPLRACVDDLPLLVGHVLEKLVARRKHFSARALAALAQYTWPGNVRELQRAIQEAAVRSEGEAEIDISHLPDRVLRGMQPAHPTPPPAVEHGIGAIRWPRERLLAELRIAVEAKQAIQAYKGGLWKAEFMRRVYPHCKAQNAKGFSDLIRRLSSGPWGDPNIDADPEVSHLLRELVS